MYSSNSSTELFTQIKKQENIQHHLYEMLSKKDKPVVVYGAGEIALRVEKILTEHGINVAAFAVDTDWYQPHKKYLGRPVIEAALLKKNPATYRVVAAMESKRVIDLCSDENMEIYIISSPYGAFAPMGYDFILENRYALENTYHWMSDEQSRETMVAYLNMKISGDLRWNFHVYDNKQYFNECTNVHKGGIRRLRRKYRRHVRGIYCVLQGEI